MASAQVSGRAVSLYTARLCSDDNDCIYVCVVVRSMTQSKLKRTDYTSSIWWWWWSHASDRLPLVSDAVWDTV